ncbi:MAG: hypothetical protein ACHBN1_10525 [Heteroscytonema crispum UTEX LB 1556]
MLEKIMVYLSCGDKRYIDVDTRFPMPKGRQMTGSRNQKRSTGATMPFSSIIGVRSSFRATY